MNNTDYGHFKIKRFGEAKAEVCPVCKREAVFFVQKLEGYRIQTHCISRHRFEGKESEVRNNGYENSQANSFVGANHPEGTPAATNAQVGEQSTETRADLDGDRTRVG